MKRVAFSNAFNADFKEEKHKRDKDGKFSKTSSGGSSREVKASKQESKGSFNITSDFQKNIEY